MRFRDPVTSVEPRFDVPFRTIAGSFPLPGPSGRSGPVRTVATHLGRVNAVNVLRRNTDGPTLQVARAPIAGEKE